MKKIIFYRTAEGKCYIEEFLDSLTDKQAKKIAWVLRIVRDTDPVPPQYLKKLSNSNDIFEVRITVSNNIFRLLGFFYDQDFVILTNGFHKKTQKTPRSEIKLAEERKRNFLKRRNQNG